MKKLLLVVALGAAGLNLSPMALANNAPNSANTLDVQEVRGTALQQYYASRAAFKAVRGVYDMDDGTVLAVYQNGHRFVAEVTGSAPVEVRAASDDTFVAVDGSAEFRFRQGAGGLVANVVLTKVSRAG
jgi:hypothetical protein